MRMVQVRKRRSVTKKAVFLTRDQTLVRLVYLAAASSSIIVCIALLWWVVGSCGQFVRVGRLGGVGCGGARGGFLLHISSFYVHTGFYLPLYFT